MSGCAGSPSRLLASEGAGIVEAIVWAPSAALFEALPPGSTFDPQPATRRARATPRMIVDFFMVRRFLLPDHTVGPTGARTWPVRCRRFSSASQFSRPTIDAVRVEARTARQVLTIR